jgi:hypothetical protein
MSNRMRLPALSNSTIRLSFDQVTVDPRPNPRPPEPSAVAMSGAIR